MTSHTQSCMLQLYNVGSWHAIMTLKRENEAALARFAWLYILAHLRRFTVWNFRIIPSHLSKR